jgi:hypothetical protein
VVDVTQAWNQTSVSQQIRQGCDYSITVELGELNSTGMRLGSIFFSNSRGVKQGEILRKEGFQGQPQVNFKVTLRITPEGQAAGLAGVNVTPQTPPPATAGDYDWRSQIQLVDVRSVGWNGQDYGSPHFRDVLSHTNDRFNDVDLVTIAHESMHGLVNEMRNATQEKDQFVYFENGKGAYILEPRLDSSLIRKYVPAGAREIASHTYQTYLLSQVAQWRNFLMFFDEFNAYKTGVRVGVEVVNARQWRGESRDFVAGVVDFIYFAGAAVQALKVNDPNYLNTNVAFKAAFAMVTEESMKYVAEGVKMREYNGTHAEQLLTHFKTSPENEAIRTTLKEWMGTAWTQRVFGF